MAIRKRETPYKMNFGANLMPDGTLDLIIAAEGGTRVTTLWPKGRALQLRDKLNELYPDE